MSVQPDPATVTGAPVGEAQANAAEEADKHTPETPAPTGDVAKTDPTDAKDGLAELREQVQSLATSVATLTDAITNKVTEPDEPTERVPLLLRGKKVHE